jgi:hypothetical protein
MLLSLSTAVLATGLLASAANLEDRGLDDGVLGRGVKRAAEGVSLNVLTKSGKRNATAPLLYGWMFEDINHSGDGGLYGELLVNRAFEGSNVAFGSVPDFTMNSLTYQENKCLPGGKFTLRYTPTLY